MDEDELDVVDVPEAGRYELRRGDEVLGHADYRRRADGTIELPHTEVEDHHEHEGLGSTLARGALDDLRDQGVEIRPTCPFIRSFIDEHPEYEALVAGS